MVSDRQETPFFQTGLFQPYFPMPVTSLKFWSNFLRGFFPSVFHPTIYASWIKEPLCSSALELHATR